MHSRCKFAMERAGVSITITSVTNFLAFALGWAWQILLAKSHLFNSLLTFSPNAPHIVSIN